MDKQLHIISCSPNFGEEWRWVSHHFQDRDWQWQFFKAPDKGARSQLGDIRAALQAIRQAAQHKHSVLVTHSPKISLRCAALCKIFRLKIPHIAYSFHLDHLPTATKAWAMARCVSDIQRLVVYSSLEIDTYHNFFKIPKERIDMIHWGVKPPPIPQGAPLEQGSYICAIGSSNRDYKTLFAAMEHLPHIPLVAVAYPANCEGLHIPPNVRLRYDIPYTDVCNIVAHAKFMTLPLQGKESRCGHGTLVMSMFLNTPLVISDTEGIEDYVKEGKTAITCAHPDPKLWAQKIAELWDDPKRCQQLANNGHKFVNTHCTEESVAEHFQHFVNSLF